MALGGVCSRRQTLADTRNSLLLQQRDGDGAFTPGFAQLAQASYKVKYPKANRLRHVHVREGGVFKDPKIGLAPCALEEN